MNYKLFFIPLMILMLSVPLLVYAIGDTYEKKDNIVYCNGHEIAGADYATFAVLNPDYFLPYAKDKNNVYKSCSVLEGADADTFISLGHAFAKDSKSVYVQGRALEGVDLETFEYLGSDYYSKDKNNVYYSRSIVDNNEEIDVATFEILSDKFAKDKNIAYRITDNSMYGLNKIQDSDPDSFIPLNETYSRDKNYAYNGTYKLKDCDVSTFEAITENVARDKNGYFYHSYRISDEEKEFYTRYDDRIIIGNCDNSDFQLTRREQLSNNFYKDDNCVYHDDFLIERSHPDSFVILNSSYAKDNNYVYYYNDKLIKPLDFGDVASFIPLEYEYGKDKYIVYYQEKEIKDSDPVTFEVICQQETCTYNAQDKNKKYYKSEEKFIDGPTQKIFNEASIAYQSGTDLEIIVSHNKTQMNVALQQSSMDKYTNRLCENENISINEKYAINNFVVYGTETTKLLGAGERAGVLFSYKSTYSHLPTTESHWQDIIKISNGRWPTERNTDKEDTLASSIFEQIYKRVPNLSGGRGNPYDDTTIMIMAYGLRPSNRNMDSEKAAINSFHYFFDSYPQDAEDWDIVRAIAYSGATQGPAYD